MSQSHLQDFPGKGNENAMRKMKNRKGKSSKDNNKIIKYKI